MRKCPELWHPRLRSPIWIASAICTPWWFSTIFGAWFCACFVDEMLADKEKRCWVPAAPHLYAQASCCQRDLGKDHGVPLLVLHSSVQWQNTKERLWGAGCRWPQRQANEEMCPLGYYWAITGGLEFFASEFNWLYRNANEICPCCCADQKQESERPFTDMRPTAAWRSTILSPADLAKKFKHPKGSRYQGCQSSPEKTGHPTPAWFCHIYNIIYIYNICKR